MTPASNFRSRDTDPINGGWLVFGTKLAESFQPVPSPVSLHPKEARALRLAGRLQRLWAWWTRPLPHAGRSSATEAATRLEILTRGGFQR
ncbi:MAG: hypothetical protein FD150_103 [Rhodobacteraceae bacterium]|nr:MAG: hypothetical protein FD150_103 [Paracoccaceae bacterium]